MVWGIEKFFDHKQCYKYFRKNFDIEKNGFEDKITHLCKQKNKPFFIVKLEEEVNVD